VELWDKRNSLRYAFRIAVGITMLALLLGNGANAATTITVPDDYAKIQWAIDNATAGDTIEVYSGTYYENVNVNKQLILKGVDTGGGKPVVDAGGSGSALIVKADGVTLEGFIASNSGILVYSNNSIIIGNKASKDIELFGILCYVDSCLSHGNEIINNSAAGIKIIFSKANNFTNNTVNGRFSIVGSSNNNYIKGNTIDGRIDIADFSTGNSLIDNTINGEISMFQCGGSNNLNGNNLNGDISILRSDASIYNNIFNSGNIRLNLHSSANIVGNKLNSGGIFIPGPYAGANIMGNIINSKGAGISIGYKITAFITGNTVNSEGTAIIIDMVD
jgi:hypothetical protein